jgi:amino acid adenylation domain-containing protein
MFSQEPPVEETGLTDDAYMDDIDSQHGYDIAVIGLAGRFPGAETIEAFWNNLVEGVESIRVFTREEMEAAGVEPALLDHPHYVNAGGHLENADMFDSGFFGFYPREADILDPQHRIFLEVAWEAIERAGYNPDAYNEPIGLFAGMSMGAYIYFNLMRNRAIRETVQPYQLPLSSDKDFLTTRVSYKLNLKGPSVDVQTACSTSLVAVHLACQSLLNYECDMALAGGVSVRVPQKSGYLYQEGGILSPDGHCRPFSADARGTVGGEGAGVVVLKRLEDALRDGDTIYAVIKGTSINNDGAGKVGYTAPSVDGQARAIANAQVLAGVDPASVSYIEAHGTGTMLGDPIEIEALSQVFREHTDEKQFCAIGSVKANIGHLDAAAGVAGLIKTILALQHKQIPPSINFAGPNPQIDFENSPFYVQDRLADWVTDRLPRRAGVSSFGMGGTNAHAVLEEAPEQPPSGPSRAWQLVILSARTASALDQASDNLAAHFRQHPDTNFADAAYTLIMGRKLFKYRRLLVAKDGDEAVAILENREGGRVFDTVEEFEGRPVAFMFSGQGAQYVNMARDVYENEPIFAAGVDRCADLLMPHLGLDIRDLIFPPEGQEEAAAEQLKQTRYTQPALFTIEYALAQLWMHWGVQPSSMIGHSIGEYVAATLAGVFDLSAALELVVARGRLMQSMPGGAMLSVQMSEAEIIPYLEADDRLSLAGINAPGLVVVSGPYEAVDDLEQQLDAAGHGFRRLRTSHAFHSSMMTPILDPFAELVQRFNPQPPQIPFVSNVTGEWITPEQATDPAYWAQHLRQAVRFADGVQLLMKGSYVALLEVGPGDTLARLARWNNGGDGHRIILHSLRHPRTHRNDQAFLLETLGQLWLAGVRIEWDAFYEDELRYRIPLPTYPFQRQRHWIEPDMEQMALAASSEDALLIKRQNIQDWLYVPSWRRSPVTGTIPSANGDHAPWLIFRDKLGDPMIEILTESGFSVYQVWPADAFAILDDGVFSVRPGRQEDIQALIATLDERGQLPETIVIAWNENSDDLDDAIDRGIRTFIALARVLHERNVTRALNLVFIGHNALDFSGMSEIQPCQAMALGPSKVIREEFPNIHCRFMDILVPENQAQRLQLARKVARDIVLTDDVVVAYRGGRRWAQAFEPLQPPHNGHSLLRSHGVYLITGGLGNMGLLFAGYLARKVNARLILVGRTPLPPREEWDAVMDSALPDDPIVRKIQAVSELEQLGAEVLILSADVADESAMAQVISKSIAHFGELHGVFHAAGVVGLDALTPLADMTDDAADLHWRAKVRGTMTLARVLEDRDLDFVLLQSSLSTVLGGYGMAAYAAANAFMDAFAARQSRRTGIPWMSINWDGWAFEEGGMTNVALGGASELAILPDEGLQVLDQVLVYDDLPQVVVSTADLEARLKKLYATEAPQDEEMIEDAAVTGMHPRPELATPFVAPETELEKAIAGLWEKTLGIAPVGINDDFFELGGHSLLATQIVSRLRDSYQVALPLRRLFENPTVTGLVALIEDERQDEAATSPAGLEIKPVPRQETMPLSPGQQRLWFLDQLDPGTPLYNNFAAIRMQGHISIPLLAQSLNAIVQRHEILRTTFHEVGGSPVQRIHDHMAIDLPVKTISGTSPEERDALIQELAVAHARKPFDLRQGPLLRAEVLRLDEDDHVIFFTMHHIVSDGWSVAVLLEELTTIYRALASGEEPDLPPLPIQYADFAAWQLERVGSDEMADQVAWWEEQLADLEPLNLPTDRPRPPVQTSNGANEWFQVPEDLYQRLTELAQRQGVTTFMLLTASLSALLHRYTMQDDIALGTPIANRTRVETESLIGFLLNTLVLRTDLSGNPTFADLLSRVKETTLNAYDHQDAPFEMLVEALQPERDMSRTPLFQVMIDLQQSQLSRFELPNLTLSLLRYDDGTAKFDMAFSLEETPDTISGYVNYNTDLFDRSRIQRLIRHWMRLLDAAIANPDLHLSQLPLLSDEEVSRLDTWGGLADLVPVATLDLMAQFDAQVAETPGAEAVIQGDGVLTYVELDARANQVAHALMARGVGPEQVVGVLLPRSPDLIVALLGILKAGASFVILAPDYPEERMRFILEDAGVETVISDQYSVISSQPDGPEHETADASSRIAYSVLRIPGDEVTSQPVTAPQTSIHPESAAYIIYTSGTTGHPKGVLVERGVLSRHLDGIRHAFGITPADRVLQFAALTFDQGLEQVFLTLTTGATLVMRGEDVWPPEAFADVVRLNRLTVINLPPAYLSQVMHAWEESPAQITETDLRLIISGGEALTPEIVAIWRQVLPAVKLINAYGPTEAVITATTYPVPRTSNGAAPSGALPIGQPVAPRTAVILDRYGNRMPIGVPGELCIGGDAIARCYLNRPRITAAAFIPDPFRLDNGRRAMDDTDHHRSSRLYRTGDLARFREDGAIEFLGRIDHQVKVRGFRIELGEIEAVLHRHPAIDLAVAHVHDNGGDKQLVAYIYCDNGDLPTVADLHDHLKAHLPHYMIPGIFIHLEEVPLTRHGKVNRRALPPPDDGQRHRLGTGQAYVAPSTPVEEDLARIWAEVLGLEQVGVHDNFFELGGHSLLATQIASRVRELYDVEVPLRSLFESPTIAQLAALITEAMLESVEEEELVDLLEQLDELSEDELLRLLEDEE